MNRPLAVLLTACVTPQISSRLTVVDASSRRAEYQAALGRWIDLTEGTNSRIVLAENSGEQLESWPLPRGAASRVELVACAPPPPAATARGKGAAEALLIDEAIARSVPSLDADVLFKCTGRLVVRNWRRLAAGLIDGVAVVVDLPKQPAPEWIDSRFFGADLSTWGAELSGFADLIDDEEDVVYEHVLARAAAQVAGRGGAVRSFVEQPWIEGRSGTSGLIYSRSAVKNVLRPAIGWAGRRRRRAASL